jgi:tetratricopeptide (TPR) repeat protein
MERAVLQIKSQVSYLSDVELEILADSLLERYQREIEPIFGPPVPVEKIADFLLELNIEWLDIPDTDKEPILAYLHPNSRTIRFNERRLDYFEQYPGVYEYTLAHEIGHYQLHVLAEDGFEANSWPDQVYVYRHRQADKDRREWQAERFASYLLMPASLLVPAIERVNLQHWPDLYQLRDRFSVSITALRIRLETLGYLHVAPNGRIYPNQSAAAGDRRQEARQLVSQGQLYSRLGDIGRAREAYRQALQISRELGDRRTEAWLAWQLGLLYVDSDPLQAIPLMSVCVAYEREIGHPQAEADAEYVAGLKARLGQSDFNPNNQL